MNSQLSAHQLRFWLTVLEWRLGLGVLIVKPLVCTALSSIVVDGLSKIVKITSFSFCSVGRDRAISF